MSEEEQLGKLAYEAYGNALEYVDPEHWPWEELAETAKQHWIAAAKAVAERVIAEMQTAEEASE